MQFLNYILLLLGMAVFGIVSLFTLQRVDRYLDNLAIRDCSMAYRRETTEGNQKIIRPLEQQLRECVWQKGVKKWNGVWSQTPKQ